MKKTLQNLILMIKRSLFSPLPEFIRIRKGNPLGNLISRVTKLFSLLLLLGFNAVASGAENDQTTTCNILVTFTRTSTYCSNTCDGSLTANPTNGTAPYTFLWNNGQTTAHISGLCKGIYTVTITDHVGCTKMTQVNVVAPAAVRIRSVVQTNVACKGICTGSLFVVPCCGIGNGTFTYLWSNNQTTASIINLCKSTYTVTVTDSRGCTVKGQRTITEPSKALVVSIAKIGATTCVPTCNGSATANPLGGVTPYTYLWSNGSTAKSLTALCGGVYTVSVTDKNGCKVVTPVTISSTCCNISAGQTNVVNNTKCSPCNGSISVTGVGASGTYSYLWSNGATTATISGLCAGTYSVTIADFFVKTCFVKASFTVADNIVPLPTLSLVINKNCPGGSTGSIQVNGLNDPSAQYLWSNGATTNPATSLTAGNYSVIVVGGNGCTVALSGSVTDKPQPNISVTPITCHDLCNGSASVINNQDYQTFSWSNGSTQLYAVNLCSGTGSVTVTDYDGCAINSPFTLANPDQLVATISVVSNETITGAADGKLQGSASGGTVTSGYSYQWSNGPSTSDNNNLTEGTYTLTVTDNNGCTDTISEAITTNIICNVYLSCYYEINNSFLGGNYDLHSIPGGGTSPYTFLWNTGATTQNVFNETSQPPYTVTVTDLYGCSSSSSCGQLRTSDPHGTISLDNLLSIYPNPFTSGFVIKYFGDDQFKITITDASGRIVNNASGLTKEIKMGSSLTPGIYLIYLESNNGNRYYQKVIKTE